MLPNIPAVRLSPKKGKRIPRGQGLGPCLTACLVPGGEPRPSQSSSVSACHAHGQGLRPSITVIRHRLRPPASSRAEHATPLLQAAAQDGALPRWCVRQPQGCPSCSYHAFLLLRLKVQGTAPAPRRHWWPGSAFSLYGDTITHRSPGPPTTYQRKRAAEKIST